MTLWVMMITMITIQNHLIIRYSIICRRNENCRRSHSAAFMCIKSAKQHTFLLRTVLRVIVKVASVEVIGNFHIGDLHRQKPVYRLLTL